MNAFRLACFNVLAKNMDDHSKNFAYLYSEESGRYILSPAYDLTRTFNQSQHEMTCMGCGIPGEDELMELASISKITKKLASEIIEKVSSVVGDRLKEWL